MNIATALLELLTALLEYLDHLFLLNGGGANKFINPNLCMIIVITKSSLFIIL